MNRLGLVLMLFLAQAAGAAGGKAANPQERIQQLLSYLPDDLANAKLPELPEQMVQRLLKFAPEADVDHDGKLSQDELRQYLLKLKASMPAAGKGKKTGASALPPTFSDVKYGPYERNVLDFWLARNTNQPAPLIVFIHGGGFVAGDKAKASPEQIRQALEGGAAFMSICYRFRPEAPIQDILRDSARSIQFVRLHAAEYHIDPKRVASYGGSAGAGTSLWLATHDDLADPKAEDPVLRQSSRLSAAGMLNGQSTYNLLVWDKEVLPFKKEWGKSDDEGPAFYHFKSEADFATERGKKILADVDMLHLLTPDDAPIFMHCSMPDGETTSRGHWLHHPRHTQVIEKRCQELGIEVVAKYRTENAGSDAIKFLLAHLGPSAK